MTKSPILPGEELLNELTELNQENERPLPPEQLVGALLETDWDSDEVRSLRTALQRPVKSMPLWIDMGMPLPKGRQRK